VKLPRLLSRRTDRKDVVIGMLGVLVLALLAIVARDHLSLASWMHWSRVKGEPVQVFDVALDRDGRRFIDVLFDRPIGEGLVGAILDPAPAAIVPAQGGIWRWRDRSVLRFEPTDRLPIATEFTIRLDPARLIPEGFRLASDRRLKVKTETFLVEQMDVQEETSLAGKDQVVLRGTVRFNYPVDPRELATRMRLADPARGSAAPLEIQVETAYTGRVIGFRTPPLVKRKEARVLRFTISRELTPDGGNVKLATLFTREVTIGSSVNLLVRGVQATPGEKESVIALTFSSPVNAGVASGYLAVEPSIAYRLGGERNVLTLTGPFRPGDAYTLKLGKGMPATDEAALPDDWSSRVAVPNLQPSVSFQSEGMFLSRSGGHRVALRTVNVPKVQLAIDRVYLNNLFFLFQYYGDSIEGATYYGSRLSRSLGDRLFDKSIDIEGETNRTVVTPLEIDRLLGDHTRGLYRLVVNRPDDYSGRQSLLLLTDLGLVAKQTDDGFLVWATSFTSLAPVANARVVLRSEQNQVMAEGRTDATGMWRVSGLAGAYKQASPYLVTVESGDDFAFLLLGQTRIDTTGLDVGGAPAAAGGYGAYLYGERDLYRPGEIVRGVAVVRDAALQPPPSMPVVLRRRDPQGRERESVPLRTDRRGLAPFEVSLPDYVPTGKHSLELLAGEEVIGRYLVQVEEFVPDRIKVEIAPEKKEVGPGEELAYDVVGTYLFGPPGADLPVETRVRVVDADFAPEKYKEYTFRNAERSLDAREILSEEGALDAQGRRHFSARVPAGVQVPSSLGAVVTARVSEQGGRGVTALQRIRLHPYPYYIGLRRAFEGYAEPGQEASFEYVAVDPSGGERPAGGLRAELYRDRWNTVLRRTTSGGFTYESLREASLIDSRALPGGAARGRVAFRIPEYGAYRVVLTDPETAASTEVSFYAAGWGYSPWAIKNPARVELQLDQDEYQPGQTATVLVQAPFSGRLLLTVERDRVLYTEVRDLKGNTAKIDIPVRAEFRPNAYVTATLVRAVGDMEAGSVGRAFGAVPIQVDRASNRTPLTITVPQLVRGETSLAIRVKGDPNAALTVAAVDEGILQLIAQQTADPFTYFYRKLALGVASYDTYTLLLPEVPGVKRAPAGGGEAESGRAQYVRTEGMRRVKPVGFWSGVVETDGAGEATVTFKLPEFQGALRVMAVASRGRRFGSADRLVRVRDPLVVLPTFPRFLSFDETLQIPISVRNDTGKDGTLRVALTATGPARVDPPAERALEVPNGAERILYVPVKSGGEAGSVHFEVRASGLGETAHATADLPVRADLPPRTVQAAGSIRDRSTTLALDDPGWSRPGTLTRTLRIGALPLLQFSGRLDDLLHYPYGCLEQTVSSSFPLIYLEDLAKQIAPDTFKKRGHSPEAMVQEGIRRVLSMQLADGGFTLWPGGTLPHPWGTVYAVHFLVEARRAGYEVGDFAYKSALDYLGSQAKAKTTFGADDLQRTVYALFVLARADRADTGTMDFIHEHHLDALPAESRALLAAAYSFAGDATAVETLASGIKEVETVQRQTGENFNSTVRNLALLLMALSEARPDDPRIPGLVDRLGRETTTDPWWTTQESAYTLLALGQLARRQAAQPPYGGVVFAGDQRLGTFDNKPATFGGITGTAPIRVEMNPGYQAGAAFYSVLARGIPADDRFKPENAGLEVQRAWLDRNMKPIDLRQVRQGDLVVVRIGVRSITGPVSNVVVQNLLPSGLEVENPRLQTTESVAAGAAQDLSPAYLDLRDDRVLQFVNLYGNTWQTGYALLRAVTPGTFRLPPLQAEAMYNGALHATGDRGTLKVLPRDLPGK
jgi:alpha-2-macroglobulin